MVLYNKFTSLKIGDDTLWGMILVEILTYFLLFSPTSTFDLKVSALT